MCLFLYLCFINAAHLTHDSSLWVMLHKTVPMVWYVTRENVLRFEETKWSVERECYVPWVQAVFPLTLPVRTH